MEKDSFVFHKEWRDAISGLPGEIRLEVYEAIIEYGTSGTQPTGLKPMAILAFNFAKTTLDKDSERYRHISEKRREAVNKRWNHTKDTKNTNVFKSIQKIQTDTNDDSPPCDSDSDLQEPKGSMSNKETPKGVKKAAGAATLPKRMEKFYEALIPFVQIYGKQMVRAFYDYWTEPNKSKTQMRFEMEKTWDLGRRLKTWASRDTQFSTKSNENVNRNTSSEERARDAADIIARLAAEE